MRLLTPSTEARGAGVIVVRRRARCCLDQSSTRSPSDAGRSPDGSGGCDGIEQVMNQERCGNDLVKLLKERVEVGG